jgi:DNA-binding SARP family transcriptional activator
MRFRYLGNVEFRTEHEWCSVSGSRPRTLFALLMVNIGRLVPVERLIAELWPDGPPASAPALIRGYVLQLRKALGDFDRTIITTRPTGYELGRPAEPVDAAQFETLAAKGLAELDRDDPRQAEIILGEALSLWRGTPFLDVASTPSLNAEASRLVEFRLLVAEAHVEARLQLGKHAEVVRDLRALLRENPLREGSWAQLMRAFYTAGHRADALEAYRRARAVLTEELGLDPGSQLQALHQMILTDATPPPGADPEPADGAKAATQLIPAAPAAKAPAPPSAPASSNRASSNPALSNPAPSEGADAMAPDARPAGSAAVSAEAGSGDDGEREPMGTLPNEIFRGNALFAGREKDLARIEALLLDKDGPQVVVIDGVGGVGKSELAIHLAHRLADRFPDGLCHVHLQGGDGNPQQPLEPVDILARLLRSLGVAPIEVPGDVAEAAARFRSLTAHRRMLFVLDNAWNETQVRPLLPARSCGVLVTSRRALPTLGGVGYHLEAMPEHDSLAMLAGLVMPERIAGEPDQALRIVRLCGRLPLALRIAGARLALRPHWPLRFFADKLASEQHRLDELKIDDLAVRTSFAISCQDLESVPSGREPVRVFRFLGVPRWSVITVPVAAALTALPPRRCEDALERLLDARLLESPSPRRYQMHDLMRLFAREQAVAHLTEPERSDALRRLLDYYVAAGLRVTMLVDQLNVRWLTDRERRPPGGADLAAALSAEIESSAEAIAWLDEHRANLVAVVRQAAGIPGTPERMAIRLTATVAGPLRVRGHLPDACALSEAILPVTARVGDVHAEARAHLTLSCCRGLLERDDERMFKHSRRALELSVAAGDIAGEARALYEMGAQLARRHEITEAADRFQRSLELLRSLEESHDEVLVLHQLGLLEKQRGRTERAVDYFRQGAALARDVGYRHGEFYHLASLGRLDSEAGELTLAVSLYDQALALAREVGEWHGEAGLLWDLARILERMGRSARAQVCRHEALDVLAGMGVLAADQAELLRRSASPPTPVPIREGYGMAIPVLGRGGSQLEGTCSLRTPMRGCTSVIL